jgi:hypothetical protein
LIKVLTLLNISIDKTKPILGMPINQYPNLSSIIDLVKWMKDFLGGFFKSILKNIKIIN